jgi:hypothetical protein
MEAFAKSHAWLADPRRRTIIARMGSTLEGFSLQDAREHLLVNVPGLYAAVLSTKSVHYLFHAPRKGTREASKLHKQVNAKKTLVKNDARAITQEVHFARAQQNLFREFHAYHGLPWYSGVNIIQVGRPAVYRYHRNRRFFMEGEGPNFEVHDWALAALGMKLGGFMRLDPPCTPPSLAAFTARPRSRSL